jgi:predicted O-methyltransferase YrrM
MANMYIPRHVNTSNRKSAWQGHIPFAYWLVGHTKPNSIVELGTHMGGSHFAFCDSVQKNKLQTQCYAIDTWEGDDHAGHYSEEVYEFVSGYNQKYSRFSHLLRMRFEEAVGQFEDGSIDILHIDGFHTYEAVRGDFETWRPKLKPDAIILFHDISRDHADFGVKRYWQELKDQFPGQHFSFSHSHGLGVLSLDKSRSIHEILGITEKSENLFRLKFEIASELTKLYVKTRVRFGIKIPV